MKLRASELNEKLCTGVDNRKGREKTTTSYVGANGSVETSLPCLHVWKRDLALAMMRLRTSGEEGGEEWDAFGGMVG